MAISKFTTAKVNSGKGKVEITDVGEEIQEVNITIFVILACVVAAFGGMLFGYDGGVTGGVESMDQFKRWFFPSTAENHTTTFYCQYNDQILATYSALMHFTGALASIPAGWFTQRQGRTRSMQIAGAAFVIGAIFQASTCCSEGHRFLLFIGRIFWGIGVGFGDHCATIYTAEMAPPAWRGTLNTLFQLATISGIVIAGAVNIGTDNLIWGWRLSLALAAVPGTILLLGGLFLPETPNNLIERGRTEEARIVLEKTRGTSNVDAEFNSIVAANEAVKHLENPWRTLLRREYLPFLFLAAILPGLQQWSGINAISFFAPQMFAGIGIFGSGNSSSLISALIVNAVQLVSTLCAVFLVDRVGRKVLLLCGSIQGFLAEVAAAILLAVTYEGGQYLPQGPSVGMLVLICLFSISFGYAWGPLGWLVPSEIQPINTRSAGQSVTVFTQLISGATVTQTFLKMLCSLQWGVFLFFGIIHGLAIVVVIFLIPETKGVPIEEVANVVRSHWFWRRVAYKGGVVPPMNIQVVNGVPIEVGKRDVQSV